MQKTIIVIIMALSITAMAKPKKSVPPPPTWYCFLTVDSNAQTVEACQRDEDSCNADIAMHELNADKVHCFGTTKAAAFILRHKNDGRTETIAVPEMQACKYISRSMVNEDIDLAEACKVIP